MSKGLVPYVLAPLGFMLLELEQKLEHKDCAYRSVWSKNSRMSVLLMGLFYSMNSLFLLFWVEHAKSVTHDLDPIFTVSTGFAYVWIHLYRQFGRDIGKKKHCKELINPRVLSTLVSLLTLMVISVLPGCFGAYLAFWMTSCLETLESVMFLIVVQLFYSLERDANLFANFDLQTRCIVCTREEQASLFDPPPGEPLPPPTFDLKTDKPKLQLPERVDAGSDSSVDKMMKEKTLITRKERKKK